MKKTVCIYVFLMAALTGCSGWTVQPIPYNPTPIPSRTPSIYTATPIILPPPVTATFTATSSTPTRSAETLTPSAEATFTDTPASPTFTPTLETPASTLLKIDVLGCNTSIDITHGMGEVTNAYVTISNIGTTDLDNVCATLRGLDEGRPHPDKTKCVPSLPANYQVTLKLTIDTTYKESTPIQVDVSADNGLLQRVGKDSCTDIGLFPPNVDDLGMVKPIP